MKMKYFVMNRVFIGVAVWFDRNTYYTKFFAIKRREMERVLSEEFQLVDPRVEVELENEISLFSDFQETGNQQTC